MRRITMTATAAVIVIVTTTTWRSSQAQTLQRPSDFGVRLEYGSCAMDILDTFQGMFMRETRAPGGVVSTPVMLPPETLDRMWEAVAAASFFDYPSDFHLVKTPGPGFAPVSHYRLEVRGDGRHHFVNWRDDVRPSNADADRLRTMFETLIRTVLELPEVQRLRATGAACG